MNFSKCTPNGPNHRTIERIGNGWTHVYHFEARTRKGIFLFWDKHATVPLMRLAACFRGPIHSQRSRGAFSPLPVCPIPLSLYIHVLSPPWFCVNMYLFRNFTYSCPTQFNRIYWKSSPSCENFSGKVRWISTRLALASIHYLSRELGSLYGWCGN